LATSRPTSSEVSFYRTASRYLADTNDVPCSRRFHERFLRLVRASRKSSAARQCRAPSADPRKLCSQRQDVWFAAYRSRSPRGWIRLLRESRSTADASGRHQSPSQAAQAARADAGCASLDRAQSSGSSVWGQPDQTRNGQPTSRVVGWSIQPTMSAQLVMDALTSLVKSIDFSEVLMQGMLSVLLFAGALHVDLAALAQHRWQVAGLAFLGTAISAVATGLAT
jgi:hypothetical protein